MRHASRLARLTSRSRFTSRGGLASLASQARASLASQARLAARPRSGRSFGSLGWLAVGASLASLGFIFFDPTRGAARRAMLRDKTVSNLRRVREGTRGRLLDARSRFRGAVHEVRSRLSEGEVSDEKIEERVRAQIGRVVSHPGALRINATQGVIEISGPVIASEAEELIASIRRVRGVKDVLDRLDVHEEAGNEPSLQGAESRQTM